MCREAGTVPHVRGRVHADQVKQGLPWLYKLYRAPVSRAGAGRAWSEPVEPALDDRYGVVLNVQRGSTMRFECHVDSNPLTGLLFCTDHPAGRAASLSSRHDPTAVRRRASWNGTARSSGRRRAT